MKALTIEELKALSIGDFVWMVSLLKGYIPTSYHEITWGVSEELFYTLSNGMRNCVIYADYGRTWLAYKNKEQAESKGIGDKLYTLLTFDICDNGEFSQCTEVYEGKIISIFTDENDTTYRLVMVGTSSMEAKLSEIGRTWFTTKEQAEARLKELRGEK